MVPDTAAASDKQSADYESTRNGIKVSATALASTEPWRSSAPSDAHFSDLKLQGVVLRPGYRASDLALISVNGAGTLMLAGAEMGGGRKLLRIASDHVVISSQKGSYRLNLGIRRDAAPRPADAARRSSIVPTRVVLASEKPPRSGPEEAND